MFISAPSPIPRRFQQQPIWEQQSTMVRTPLSTMYPKRSLNVFRAPQSSRAMDMDSKRVLMWEYGSVALISSLAAWRGFQNASRCTKLKSQYTLCLNGDEPSCKALGVRANRKAERPNTDNDAPLLQPSTPVAQ